MFSGTLRSQLALLGHTGPRQAAFVAVVDDWACALVPTASSVTLLFYGLLFQDPRFVVEACVHNSHAYTGAVADACPPVQGAPPPFHPPDSHLPIGIPDWTPPGRCAPRG